MTWPEPPAAGHRFGTLPNVVLTPHIAGSAGDEVHRMAAYMIAEYRAVAAGKATSHEVTETMLGTVA